jgi:Fe-S-cluster containining protein
MAPLVPTEPMSGDEEQAVMGLRHCHQQMNTLAQQIYAASAEIGALVRVLHERGLVTDEELAAHRQAEEQRLEAIFQEHEIGVLMDENIPDKYAVTPDEIPIIDCASRYHICRAACCALRFPLSKQDLDEGIVRWELGHPYRNRQGPDGLCVHLDRGTHGCSIYEHRPGICRIYDCRKDSRIWLDFDKGLINPELFVDAEHGDYTPQFPKRQMAVPVSDSPTEVPPSDGETA